MDYLDDILGDMGKAEVFGDSLDLAADLRADVLVNFVEISKKTKGVFFICELFIETAEGSGAAQNAPGSRVAIKLNLNNTNNDSRHSLLKGYICGLLGVPTTTSTEVLNGATRKIVLTEAQAKQSGGTPQPLRGVRMRVETILKEKKKGEGSYPRVVTFQPAATGNSKEEVAQRRAELQDKLGATK
jgi:hypothetical protein